MNPVATIAYNNWSLTEKALESVMAQDVGNIFIHITDNGSTDETWEQVQKLESKYVNIIAGRFKQNQSPVKIANQTLNYLFRTCEYSYVLCMPNDVVLPTNLYSEMLKVPRGIVAATMMSQNPPRFIGNPRVVSTATPMAVMLVRRWAYDAVVAKDGYFLDENFFHYASDCDLALRLAACGISGAQLETEYWHFGSASWRLAPPETANAINQQADVDRAYFEHKWGFSVSDPRYAASAADINFRGWRR